MEIKDIIELVLAVLGVGSIVARFTKTRSDNAVVDFLLRSVHLLGLTKGGPSK